MPEFKPGDIVQLRSGGQYMTVSFVDGDMIRCDWHDLRGKPHSENYSPEQLVHLNAAGFGVATTQMAPAGPVSDDADWRKKHGLG